MKNSSERIKYIAEYITSYETKIKALNKNGLFDAAKLFELFAIEVCGLWFGQPFYNLNDEVLNYPGVDLVTENKDLYVQVSTQQNIPSKISKTLNKVKENKSKKLSNVKEVYFFVLNTDTIDKVKDYSGEDRIGNIDFEAKKHLITTQHIISRATSDLDFQIKLYDLLLKEDRNLREVAEKLSSIIEDSKTIGLRNIDCLINDEYEIDRSDLVNKIKNSNCQFFSVRGEAGSGKSVVCKKVVEDEPYLIYARAERFTEETDINKIWHFNLEYALNRLSDKQVFFFIDSLEFIADASKTKIDLLQSLYELIKKYPNTKIITSCRTNDSTAFGKIDARYSIETYYVEELTTVEINKLAQKYPVINTFMSDNSYIDLIKTPFYINLVVRNITDKTNINDENKLRDFIWENVICLKEKASQYKLRFDEIANEIRKIVLNRAMSFSVGVYKEDINSKILDALKSESIVIENGCTIRLKYDIFEDICFEKIIDKEFDACKGDYTTFFSKIEEFGRCCYRRYQIWISNKLLSKINRDKFIYKLIFTKDLPDNWTKQTMIGLVKSRFCASFFEEQGDNIVSKGLVEAFVKITNLYAFEIKFHYFKDTPFVFPTPKGYGRSALIRIVYDNGLFLDSTLDSNSVKKLCSDYSKEQTYDSETAEKACSILQHYIETELKVDKKYYYASKKIITPLLNPIYQMSEFSKEWIVSFWEKQKECFLSDDHNARILAEEIIEYTLKCTTINLAKNLPKELCDLADVFWTSDLNDSHIFYGSRYESLCYYYGLNKHADSYEHSLNSLNEYHFFPNLIEQNFWIAFRWAIDFINKAISNLVGYEDANVEEVSLKFMESGESKNYYANSNMWLAGSQEYSVPTLISDIVYILKNKIIRIIELGIKRNWEYVTFASNIKKYIYQDSNSIVLFSIVEDVGVRFENELPGFALDLSTSIKLIQWDISRFVALNPCGESLELRKNIQMIMGVPDLKERYEGNAKMKFTLREYVAHMQFLDETRELCHNILDYLYSIYPNETSTAHENLQIQKMDMRNSEIEQLDDKTFAISPIVTGEAKKIVDDNEKKNAPQKAVEQSQVNFLQKLDINNCNVDTVIKNIDYVLSVMDDSDTPFIYHNHLVLLISLALSKTELDSYKRDEYCAFWIDGVESIINNGTFSFKNGLLLVLFRQINSNASNGTIQRIKRLILTLITYQGNNGLIRNLKGFAQDFLKTNSTLSEAVFNTIVMFAKDEIEHQKFIYDNVGDSEERVEYIPNKTPKYCGYSSRISEIEECYHSGKDEILEKYLYNEEKLDLSGFDISNYDVETLCSIVGCGAKLENHTFVLVLREVVRCVIDMWNSVKEHYRHYYTINVYSAGELSEFLGKELLQDPDCVIDILFSDIDFASFSEEAIKFYLRVFGVLLPKYVDSYNNSKLRHKCETVLQLLEQKINAIKCNDYVRKELYRSLIMSVSGYEGDWSQVPTNYTYNDIQFLNTMYSRYGKYHFKYFMHTISQMKLEKLLPGILQSVCSVFEAFTSKEFFSNTDYEDVKYLINRLIVLCFVSFNDEIKQVEDLTKSYEIILEILTELNSEEAAVLLDEFRIH